MPLTIDEVLERIGGQGRFQIIVLCCMSYVFMSMAAYHLMVIAFIAGEPYWECVENSTVCNLTEAVSTVSKHYNERCGMARSEWRFLDTYTSTVTEVIAVCKAPSSYIMIRLCPQTFVAIQTFVTKCPHVSGKRHKTQKFRN